jgi:heme exporter protein D
MSDWHTFFAMGGYAAFVWPAYAASFLALFALALWSWREMKRSEHLADMSEKAKTPDR